VVPGNSENRFAYYLSALGDPSKKCRETSVSPLTLLIMDVPGLSPMSFRFVEEAEAIPQSLLEIYVAVALGTPFNDFDVH